MERKVKWLLVSLMCLVGIAGAGSLKVLDFPVRTQWTNMWCWNASTEAILAYHGIYLSQHQIVSLKYPYQASPWQYYSLSGGFIWEDSIIKQNVIRDVHSIVNIEGLTDSIIVKDTTPSIDTAALYSVITNQLDRGHPMIFVWDWLDSFGDLTGSGHAMDLYGYDELHGAKKVYYMNPWLGLGATVSNYSVFAGKNGHEIVQVLAVYTNDAINLYPLVKDSAIDTSYALYGFEWLNYHDGAVCKDSLGNYCKVGSGWLKEGWGGGDSIHEQENSWGVNIGAHAKVGSVYSTGTVWLRSGALVTGEIGTLNGNPDLNIQDASVSYGSVKANLEYGIPSASFGFGHPRNVMNDQARLVSMSAEPGVNLGTLAPGAYYGDLTMKARSSIMLTAGDYVFSTLSCDFCNLNINVASGPVRIFVLDNVYMTGTPTILNGFKSSANGTMVGVTGNAGDFALFYLGTNDMFLSYNFRGAFFAPNATLIMAQAGKTYEGMFQAKRLEVHQYANITFVPFHKGKDYVSQTVVLRLGSHLPSLL